MNLSREQRRMAVAGVVLVAAVWWLASSPQSPIRPQPKERPVLQFLAKAARVAARVGLMALFFAEPAQADADEVPMAAAALGVDGYQILDNQRW